MVAVLVRYNNGSYVVWSKSEFGQRGDGLFVTVTQIQQYIRFCVCTNVQLPLLPEKSGVIFIISFPSIF